MKIGEPYRASTEALQAVCLGVVCTSAAIGALALALMSVAHFFRALGCQ